MLCGNLRKNRSNPKVNLSGIFYETAMSRANYSKLEKLPIWQEAELHLSPDVEYLDDEG